jgi:hypothetical protein
MCMLGLTFHVSVIRIINACVCHVITICFKEEEAEGHNEIIKF